MTGLRPWSSCRRQRASPPVVLNNPSERDALSMPMLEQLNATFSAVAADPDVQVLVVMGAGGNFCVGGDFQGSHRRHDAHRGTEPICQRRDRQSRRRAAAGAPMNDASAGFEASPGDEMIVEQRERVMVFTLNRPWTRNAVAVADAARRAGRQGGSGCSGDHRCRRSLLVRRVSSCTGATASSASSRSCASTPTRRQPHLRRDERGHGAHHRAIAGTVMPKRTAGGAVEVVARSLVARR